MNPATPADRPPSDSARDAPGVADQAAAAAEQVREWLAVARGIPVGSGPAQLAGLLRDPAGLDFAVGFVDGVIRPEDPHVAATTLRRLAGTGPGAAGVPRSIPAHLRWGLGLAAVGAGLAPALVVPVVRWALRALVGHLVVDAGERALGRHLTRLRGPGTRLNINLLGEAVLGRGEADRRLADLLRLVRRDDVDYVSVKASAVIGPHSPWAFDHAVEETCDRLRELYRAARDHHTFLNLDMEEYRDLAWTLAVFTRLLDEPDLADLEAGIVLQAYLPDSLAAMQQLQDWASRRRARGGAPIKVRLVKGANLPMEQVEGELRGWPLATWSSKQDTDTHYKRVLDWALRPEHTEAVRLGVAGHNLFDIAWAWQLAGRRGVRGAVDVEMLLGMAPAQAEAVRRSVGSLVLYTPVVHPAHFDVAIAYLVRRLEEGAAPQNFMRSLFDLDDPATFERELGRFVASLEALALPGGTGPDEAGRGVTGPGVALPDDGAALTAAPAPRRTQDRTATPEPPVPGAFHNAPDTDPALPRNLAWADRVLDLARSAPTDRPTGRGAAGAPTTRIEDPAALDQVLTAASTAAPAWQHLGSTGRAAVLRAAAVELERRRADLVAVMASECGKTIAEADPEVSEAVDFAAWYADQAERLDHIDGARHQPVNLVVVTPPWNFPVAIPAGSTLAGLAAGAAVVLKPAPQAERCSVLLAEALWAAGVPREVLQLALLDEGGLGRQLVTDPRVDRLVLTGAWQTAELFSRWRPELHLLAETSGKNAIVVIPSADIDLAVRDVVASAFGHAGQKCSAASLVILVGAVGRSRRFRHQLIDATRSLQVGWPTDAATQMGPLVGPAVGKLRRALTSIEPGQSWWVEPRALDDSGRLWSPGIRAGVQPGDEFSRVEYFGPVLGVMVADDLEQAIAWQNQTDYGLTAGLHSLDDAEIATWVERVEAGNLYVNRATTGAIVARQPFGGWKHSVVGAGAKAGGPNYLFGLCDWTSAPAASDARPLPAGERVLAAARNLGGGLVGADDLAMLTRAVRSDAAASLEFGGAHDPVGLAAETNQLRYRGAGTRVRVGESARPIEVLRVAAAALATGARPLVSCSPGLDPALPAALREFGLVVQVADQDWWQDLPEGRLRLVGEDRDWLARRLARPGVALFAQPVTESGLLEGLPFVREQALSITNHRFGVVRGQRQLGSGVASRAGAW
ncbi:proline dehydrogenase family protein [Propionibacteriaceae bacterium Y1923]